MSLINYQGDSKLLKRICQLLKVTDVQDGEGHSLVGSDGIAVVTGGGGGSSTLAGLSDVDTTGASAGDVLSLDGTSGKWEGKTLATVASSGSYNDLTNKPTIPAAQVNSDWNASSGVAQILNKPTIPTVNDATLTVKNGPTTKGTFTANASSNVAITVLPFDITVNTTLGGYDVTYPS